MMSFSTSLWCTVSEVYLLLLDVTIHVTVATYISYTLDFFNFAAGCDNYTIEEEAEENPTAPVQDIV